MDQKNDNNNNNDDLVAIALLKKDIEYFSKNLQDIKSQLHVLVEYSKTLSLHEKALKIDNEKLNELIEWKFDSVEEHGHIQSEIDRKVKVSQDEIILSIDNKIDKVYKKIEDICAELKILSDKVISLEKWKNYAIGISVIVLFIFQLFI